MGYVPYCFRGSYVKFQGHRGQMLTNLALISLFSHDNLSANLSMAVKHYGEVLLAWVMCPIIFEDHMSNFEPFSHNLSANLSMAL